MDISQQFKKSMLTLMLGFVVVGVLAFFVIRDTTNFFVEKEAVSVAEIVSTFAKTARSVYSQEVIDKLKKDGYGSHVDFHDQKGFIPIPAQFLKMMGTSTSQNTSHLFEYRPVSKWNLEPSQGLSNEFLLWAWPQLEAQDKVAPLSPIDWKPIYRIEQIEDQKYMRYLVADPATSKGCVSCHNAYEPQKQIQERRKQAGVALGKQWKQHQLLGALEITIPLKMIEKRASEQLNRTVYWMLLGLVGGFVFIALVYLANAKLHRSMAKLSWQANHDELTELMNRHAFQREAKRTFKLSKQGKACHALLILDLDKFKPINDEYGHQAGDELLKQVAASLKKGRRSTDVIARLGGDEFAIILPECSSDGAYKVGLEVQKQVESVKVDWKGETLSVGASVGVSIMTEQSESLEKVIELADAASYIAKMSHDEKVALNIE